MVITGDLKKAICSLFDVHQDEGGVQRIVTPLEYPGSNDNIVVRVRPSSDGNGYLIDENGEAAFYSMLNGGDVESEAVGRWAEELSTISPVEFTIDEKLTAHAEHERLVAPYIFRVAEAAQQFYTVATARGDRHASDFKERLKEVIHDVCTKLNMAYESDVELPIAGGLKADHVLEAREPLIIIAATSPTRLLEAEVIYMQYRAEKKSGVVIAVAESQAAVGKKQYERAGYYTNRTLIFHPEAFGKLISANGGSGLQ